MENDAGEPLAMIMASFSTFLTRHGLSTLTQTDMNQMTQRCGTSHNCSCTQLRHAPKIESDSEIRAFVRHSKSEEIEIVRRTTISRAKRHITSTVQ